MTIPLTIHHDRQTVVHSAIADLIESYPLAWVTSRLGDASIATPLPLAADYDAERRSTAFIGHFSLPYRHVDERRADQRSQIHFSWPQAFVYPQHVPNRPLATPCNHPGS